MVTLSKEGKFLTVVVLVLWFVTGMALMTRAQPSPPGAPLLSTASIGILVGGKPIAAEPNINFASGNGVIVAASDNAPMGRVDIISDVNTAWAASINQVQSNLAFCDATKVTTSPLAYACQLPVAPLEAYKRGNTFLLGVDTLCATGCSLNIGGLGPIAIKQLDGVTDPNGMLGPAQWRWIVYDGSVFRLL